MVATNNVPDTPPKRSDSIRIALNRWVEARNVGAVLAFTESLAPAHDPSDDYLITYEAVFEPGELDRARIEVWATREGLVAIGLETRDRIARRLGIRTRRLGFAAGHEPREVSETGLCAFLDCVAEGTLAIDAINGVGGLGATTAVMTAAARERLLRSGYGAIQWIELKESRPTRHPLAYRPW